MAAGTDTEIAFPGGLVGPVELIARLQSVPHIEGRGDWDGADCWGLVEIWYRERFGVVLTDRADIPPGAAGVSEGFDRASDWFQVETPGNDDLVVMRYGRLRAGHVGVFWDGAVIHTAKAHDCVQQPLRRVSGVFCFLRYKWLIRF